MKNLICNGCGGTMLINATGMTAVCPYCGSHAVLNHEDTDYYKSFYSQMSRFLAGSADDRERQLRADKLWETADREVFYCRDGSEAEVRYLYRSSFRDGEMLVARKSVVFRLNDPAAAERIRRTVSFLDYPSADTRQLAQFFPNVTGGFELEDGSMLLAVSKDPDEYPLSLFGTLGGRHVAWIISRMENLCCVLEYNSLVHPLINADTLFINPYTHQASLYGGWQRAQKNNTVSAYDSHVLRMTDNLYGIRNTAAALLGFSKAGEVKRSSEIPAALADFINGRPRDNAYDDFTLWDEMLIKAYGKRKFIRMDVDDGSIYGKE